MRPTLSGIVALTLLASSIASAQAADQARGATITLGSGPKMTAPSDWVRKTPKVKIIEHEFTVPASKGDKADGRVTVMAAGGSIEANIERWFGQFTQPDGSKTSDLAKVEKKKIAGHTVHMVDVSGTYKDAPGPFAPPVDRPGYRMLAAVIETADGNYFIKFYGPKQTVADHGKGFREMLESMK